MPRPVFMTQDHRRLLADDIYLHTKPIKANLVSYSISSFIDLFCGRKVLELLILEDIKPIDCFLTIHEMDLFSDIQSPNYLI